MTDSVDSTRHADLIREAALRASAYIEGRSARAVIPTHEAIAALHGFTAVLGDDPVDARTILDQLDRLGSPATVVNTAGRYFGFVTGGTEPVAAAAAVLAGTWDQNIALPVMSPVAAHLDAIAARWVVDLLGLPVTSAASFCAGASIANLSGLLAGRDALLQRMLWSVDQRGLAGAPTLRVVASAEAHVSVFKALRAIGIGKDNIELAPTDHAGRVDASQLPRIDERTLVVLQAGNVNTGHSDPFDDIVPFANAAGAWVHIDGAFGLWAAASPRRRAQVSGAAAADSWATDAHKWLNAPYDSGIVIFARAADARRAFAVEAAYLTTDSERALMHLGLQMSQRARGIETWAAIAARGRSGIADLVDTACDHATRLANLLVAGGVEIMAPVVLNQTLVSFGDDATTDAVINAVQHDGTCWAGGTTWHGRRAMRLSVSDRATTTADITMSAAAILRCRDAIRG